ncbi:MAG: nucleotidyltransferase domain-containing protein [Bacilli bacterium]|nr:nucleotidyltransferase domain-containing protein [Bacilli bacterium]
MTLKEIRESYNLSQLKAANIVGVPVRTFRRYELDESYGDLYKRQKFIDILIDQCEITEDKGLLSIEQIIKAITSLFDTQYKGVVHFCYLFGSYAKGYATEKSDVDLCISSSLTGIRVAGLAEAIRSVLHKKIDLVRFDTLNDNLELINEIMKDGIKIYG